MLILGKINIANDKNKKKLTKLVKTFSMYYVKKLSKSKSLDVKNEQKRLKQIEQYIHDTYNTKQDIYKLIINILYAINITSNGIIYTSKEQINTIKISKIISLVKFGTLSTPRSAIFNDALNFAIKQTRKMVYYGC